MNTSILSLDTYVKTLMDVERVKFRLTWVNKRLLDPEFARQHEDTVKYYKEMCLNRMGLLNESLNILREVYEQMKEKMRDWKNL